MSIMQLTSEALANPSIHLGICGDCACHCHLLHAAGARLACCARPRCCCFAALLTVTAAEWVPGLRWDKLGAFLTVRAHTQTHRLHHYDANKLIGTTRDTRGAVASHFVTAAAAAGTFEIDSTAPVADTRAAAEPPLAARHRTAWVRRTAPVRRGGVPAAPAPAAPGAAVRVEGTASTATALLAPARSAAGTCAAAAAAACAQQVAARPVRAARRRTPRPSDESAARGPRRRG